MATAYTSLLGFALPVTGELNGTWGDVVNNSITSLVESSIAGSATASVTSGDWTLTTTGSGVANQARAAILIVTGTPGVSRNIIAPSSSKAYIVDNQSNSAIVIKGSATAGVSIASNTASLVAWDGTDFVLVSQDLSNATGTLAVNKGGTGLTSTPTNGQIDIGNGTGFTRAALTAGTGVSVTNGAGSVTIANTGVTSVTGTAPVASSGGATPAISMAAATTSVNGYLTSTDWNTFNNKTSNTGTVTSVAATAGAGISISGSPITTSGTLTVTNTAPDQVVGLTQGGTTTITGTYPNFTISSADQFAGTVTSVGGTGTVNGITLTGSVTSSGNLTLGGTLSGVNLTTQVTGTLPVANGGTGNTTAQAEMNRVAGAVTSAQYLRGNGTNVVMSAIQAADVPTLNQNTTGTAANVTGTVAVANGGTGATTLTSNNVLLGNGTGALQVVAPSTSGNVLVSNGTTWTSAAFSGSAATPTTLGTVYGNTATSAAAVSKFGYEAGNAITTATSGTFVGYQAGKFKSAGEGCTYIGSFAGDADTSATQCTAVGAFALSSFVSGEKNTAVGYGALIDCTSSNNTAIGSNALQAITSGSNNTALGMEAGFTGTNNLVSGTNNTLIGYLAQASSSSVDNQITLGNSSVSTLRCQVTSITSLSDARDKKDITPLEAGVDFVNKLNPVNFVWNMRDGGKVDISDAGFIAQELKQVQIDTGITIPNLVYEDNPDKLEASYGTLIPVLVRAIQELSAEVKFLKSKI